MMVRGGVHPRCHRGILTLLSSLLPLLVLLSCLHVPVSPQHDGEGELESSVVQDETEVLATQSEAEGRLAHEEEPLLDAASSSSSVSQHQSSSGSIEGEGHCAWGTACHPDAAVAAAAAAAASAEESTVGGAASISNGHQEENAKKSSGNSSTSSHSQHTHHIPFVHHNHHHNPNTQGTGTNTGGGGGSSSPPEGFAIVARVYTDPNDKLAHFTDDEEGSYITLPYWECGATGSTTSPLPVKHAYFRHSLTGSKPQVWSGTEYGPHPQLVVALKRMEMTLNSGETKQLKAGDVVLLEDVVSGGHKLKALEGFDMTYLLLTLPQHYHHVGRDQMALKRGSMEKKQSPCANEDPQQQGSKTTVGGGGGGGGSAFVNRQQIPQRKPLLSSKSWESILTGGTTSQDGEVVPLREPKLRKLLLGLLGVSVSTLVADFLGKVAPLWLAVGIGGTCFVVGGTAGIVQGGDYVCSEIEMWQERRRLSMPRHDDVDDDIPLDDDMAKSIPNDKATS